MLRIKTVNTSSCCILHLQLSNYCSFEGVLYCRPHYDQLFKRTGSLDKSFEGKSLFSYYKKKKIFLWIHINSTCQNYSIMILILFFSLNILSGTPKILRPERQVDEVISHLCWILFQCQFKCNVHISSQFHSKPTICSTACC